MPFPTLLVSLPLLGTVGPQDDPYAQDPGVLGTVAPQPADVVRDDLPAHLDRIGGCDQRLIDAAGNRAGGLGVVWRDLRDGNLGLYFATVAPVSSGGAPRGDDRPIHRPRTTRQLDPSLAFAADGSGALAWAFTEDGRTAVHVRAFDSEGSFTGGHFPLGERAPSGRPAIGVFPERGAVVAWREGERLALQTLDRRYAPSGAAVVVERPATGAVELSCTGGGRGLVAFQSGTAVVAAPFGPDGIGSAVDVTSGAPLELVADPAGGYWLLSRGDGLELRQLGPDGRPGRFADLPLRGVERADLAVWAGGLACLVERSEEERTELSLFFLDPEHPDQLEPIQFLPPGSAPVPGSALAGDGFDLHIAWTDARNGDADVFARSVRGGELGPPMRLNGDVASSHQEHVDVHSTGGLAALVWEDRRDGDGALYSRVVDAGGALSEKERRLPLGPDVRSPGRDAKWPAVAIRPDGTHLVAWNEREGRESSLWFQTVGRGREPLAPPAELDPGQLAEGGPPDVETLADGGWVVVWCRAGGGAFARVVAADGRPTGAPTPISAGSPARRIALARLDGGRLFAAWDTTPERGARTELAGRFLDREGAPELEVVSLSPTDRPAWDPSVAPADDGGFLLAWCSGAETDRSRDVVARFFDASGGAGSRVIPISSRLNEQDFPEVVRLADGSWVVAWEDDISTFDHGYARRIAPDRRRLGPIVTLNQREAPRVETRARPVVAPLGDGFLGAWADRRRSRGWDVYLRVLGPRFDDVADGR